MLTGISVGLRLTANYVDGRKHLPVVAKSLADEFVAALRPQEHRRAERERSGGVAGLQRVASLSVDNLR